MFILTFHWPSYRPSEYEAYTRLIQLYGIGWQAGLVLGDAGPNAKHLCGGLLFMHLISSDMAPSGGIITSCFQGSGQLKVPEVDRR